MAMQKIIMFFLLGGELKNTILYLLHFLFDLFFRLYIWEK